MAGLSQKGGAVSSHIRIAESADKLFAARIATGEANVVIGCDMVVTSGNESLAKMRQDLTKAIVNRSESITSQMVLNFANQAREGNIYKLPDIPVSNDVMERKISDAVGSDNVNFIDATHIATKLLGDSIAVNMFMLGFAWQKCLVPLAFESLMEAIEINGTAVEQNKNAFLWGRRAAVNINLVLNLIKPKKKISGSRDLSKSIDEVISKREEHLVRYQNQAYADRYLKIINRFRDLEAKIYPENFLLTEAVARGYYKLLAYKDEYEVARLFSDGVFLEKIKKQFSGDFKLSFHLAPPILHRQKNVPNALPTKQQFGSWMLPVMNILAKAKFLRGTKFDLFAYSADRKLDRQLIAGYETLLQQLLEKTTINNYSVAIELANLPDGIRGYGPIRQRYSSQVLIQQSLLLKKFNDSMNQPISSTYGTNKTSVIKVVAK